MSSSSRMENVAYLFEYEILPSLISNILRVTVILIYLAMISNYLNIFTTNTLSQITLGRLMLYSIITLLGLIIGVFLSKIYPAKTKKHSQRGRGTDIEKLHAIGLVAISCLLIITYIVAIISGVI
ncbi:MAG: hypothetical protein QW822_01410 [Desulfurococcaceae archaeon]